MHPLADCIIPDWPAPARVRSLITTRHGGVSRPPFDSFNLGTAAGDEISAVSANRARLRDHLPSEPRWLRQVHGNRVVRAEGTYDRPEADACIALAAGQVCAVLVADCMPVLFCDLEGTAVAAAHAGWRGLSAGVLENTLDALPCPPAHTLAFLGPAIGPSAFEVGEDVLEAFIRRDTGAAVCFERKPAEPDAAPKWLADLYALARRRLAAAGVRQVFGGGFCTYSDRTRFFSYRRDRQTGRQAALIWLDG